MPWRNASTSGRICPEGPWISCSSYGGLHHSGGVSAIASFASGITFPIICLRFFISGRRPLQPWRSLWHPAGIVHLFAGYQEKLYMGARPGSHGSSLWRFIRLGNLFNHEIYGDPTSMPWAFSFMLHPLASHNGLPSPAIPLRFMRRCIVSLPLLC